MYLCPQGRGSGNTAIYVNGNFTVDTEGKITANSGNIGGWSINPAGLFSGNDWLTAPIGMSANSTSAFWAGFIDGTYKFRVTNDGLLYAAEGNIAGWDIQNNWLGKSQQLDYYGNGVYYTYGAGLYAGGAGTKNTCLAIGYMPNGISGSWDSAEFRITGDGRLYATKANIQGTLQAGSIISLNQEGGTATKIGNLSFWDHSQGSVIYSPYSSSISNMRGMLSLGYTISSLAMGLTGASITLDANGAGRLEGTWSYTNGSSGSLSDINQKNSIEELNANFDTLFDKIEPIRYKYNKGTSNRYHLGYIAQQIEQSILDSALTEKDAALVIDIQDHDESGNILETSTKYLRYEEFIALNTWQIQKLKARVNELKNEIKEIKQQYEI